MITLGLLALAALALSRRGGDVAERVPSVDPVPRPPKRCVCVYGWTRRHPRSEEVYWRCLRCGRPEPTTVTSDGEPVHQ
jgi:hypothetical protein